MSQTGGGNDIPSQIATALQDSSKADVEKVGIALGVFVAASLATIIGFEILRANNKIVYEPKRKYAEVGGPAPPPLSYSFFGWMAPTWRYSEDDLLNNAGMDAVVFLRFIRLCCWICTALAVILGATLIPVDLIYNLKVKSGSQDYTSSGTALSVITLAEMNGNFLYAHVIMSYVAVIVTLFFVFRWYKSMVVLRWKYFRSEAYQSSFAARTLMLTNVPRQLQSDAAISGLLSSIGLPYPTTEVHIGRVVGSLPELIEKHDEMVRKLEHVLAKYLKDPNNVPSKRPMIRTSKMGSEKVDAIDYYTAQINKLEAAVENWRERIAEKKPESYGFASMAAVPYAHAAAKSLKNKRPNGVEIELSSEPRNILWKNLTLTKTQRFRLSSTGFIYLTILLFVNAVPLLAVALIAQMSSFTGYLPFLRSWQDSSGWSFSLVAGLLPPAISGVMGYFLPILMRKIAKYRGEQTRTKLDKVVTGQFFGFLIISQFIFFSLIGVFITSIATVVGEIVKHSSGSEIFDTLRDQTDVIKKQFLNMSNYWLTWLPLRMWMSTFDLAQGIKLVLVWIQKGLFGRTPRDVREYTKPPSFEYAIYYANFLFLFAVGAIYGVLAPLVMIFTAVVFWVSLACYKYQFMYVSVSKVESGGALWRLIVNRLLIVLVLMQVILMFVVALDPADLVNRIVKVALCAPPIVLVLAFKVYCRNRFDNMYDWYIPDPSEMAKTHVHQGDQRHHRLQRRFGHPSLHQKLFTPLVHARVKHLLPQVYHGRLEHSGMVDVAGRKLEAEEVVGGLKIAAVEDDQLEYDPKMDSDGQSMISISTMTSRFPQRKGTGDTQFQSQYQAYLAGAGPVSRTDLQDTYEMSDMRDSQENLLEKRGNVAMGPMSHSRKQSGNTLYSYGTPYATPQATPGLEYPPGDIASQPMYHSNGSNISLTGNGGYFQGGRQSPANMYSNYNGGSQMYQQRSNGSFGGMQPNRTASPAQMSSSPQMGPVRTTPSPMNQMNGGQRRQGSAGSAHMLNQQGYPAQPPYYNAAEMYSSQPAPPTAQAQYYNPYGPSPQQSPQNRGPNGGGNPHQSPQPGRGPSGGGNNWNGYNNYGGGR
ncbi:DUF221-domain-containing protein [Meira miltonrushii]|uniref:DUF221-domain-containing protein n=1 Tax=Meira miltonrushii TaxID=1280837 RepID=A0A316VK51_9BASI|nr:DUF221-domain-containing protein [Meira miltonrushii]PWN37890.1 DUF221-domain-containing protein [Meira miltonrushii]